MKYCLIVIIGINTGSCSGMEWVKSIWKSLKNVNQATVATRLDGNLQKAKPLPPCPLELKKYQKEQKNNFNGVIFPLIAAGICTINSVRFQPHENGYYYFTLATGASLGAAAIFGYKLCTTPVPAKKLEHKKI